MNETRLTCEYLFTSGQNDTLDLIILGSLVELIVELEKERRREGVESFRSIESEYGDGTLTVDEDELFGGSGRGHESSEIHTFDLGHRRRGSAGNSLSEHVY
jgi:hypothetical protein